MTLREMQEKRAKLLVQARERLDQINDNTDEARAVELEGQHDAAIAEMDALDVRIARDQNISEREAAQAEMEEQTRAARRPGADNTGSNGAAENEQPSYRDAFHAMLRVGGEMSELTSDQRSVLRSGVVDEETRAQLTTTGAAGGFTVPTELSNIMIEAMEATGPMFNTDLTFGFNTETGAEIDVPGFDDTGDTSTALAVEGAEIVDDASGDIALYQRILNAYVYATPFIKWSHEMNTDSIVNVENLLGGAIGKRLGKIGNQMLTTGTGSSQPNGVVTASALGITAASATALNGDELIDLMHSVDPAYRARAVFMMNDLTIAALRKLKDGDGNYLWQMGNIQTGTPDTVLGKQIYANQAMDTIATGKKTILFGDFKEYYVRRVGSPILGVMRERFWPKLGIAGLIRFDGEIGDSRAIKHLIQA